MAALVRHVYLPGRLAPSMAVLLMCFELEHHIETRFTGGPPLSSDFNEQARNRHYYADHMMMDEEVADRRQPSKDMSYSNNNRQDVCGQTWRN